MLWSSNDVTQQGSRPKTKLGKLKTQPSGSKAKVFNKRIESLSLSYNSHNLRKEALCLNG